MKGLKKVFSILLCAALIFSSVPVLNFTLFGTDAKAATYTKQHTKEYYYAPGTQFIAYLATGGDQDGNTAKSIVTGSGYTLIDKNLNAGVRVSSGIFSSRDADEVYLGYKTSTDPSVSLRDLRIMINKDSDYYTSPENGFAYTLVGLTPISQNDNDGGGSVDLNQSKSSADYLHYFGTKDVKAGGPIVSITINNNDNQSGYESVKYLNSGEFNNAADANRDADGEYIYTHVTRLPEVDTTALRDAMAKADTYIANSMRYVSVDALTEAKANARKITDSYDNYAAGYEAFSTVYNQAAINNAKTAIDNAISALMSKLDWTNYNAAVSKANGLNKNDYVDFSAVENALKNANLIKNSFTKQEQVDNETAKINSAINSLVKKTTTKSFVQGNAEGHDKDWTFQSCVKLEIFNVNSGTNCDYWNTGAGVDNKVGEEYEKTAQYTSDKWNASKATIYVDPDVNSDIRSTGVYVNLTMPHFHSEIGRGRWGVELAAYQNNYTMGKLRNDWRTVTVQSANGKSLTYSLCDENGNDKASAQTSNGDFTLDETISDGEKGPYTWYIKGAVPAAGDKATVRVLGICAAWAHDGNLQKLTEFTDLTIVSVSKTALKKAIYTVVGNANNYTTESYNSYTTALNEAKTVLNNPTAEQSEVDAATTKLNNAINALQAKLDMAKLYASRDKANALNSSDYLDFSEVASLVNMIPETAFNSQQEVDDYADRIELAISKLVKKASSSSLSVKSEQLSLIANNARSVNNLIVYGASKVTNNSFSRYGYEGEQDVNCPPTERSNGNEHGGRDYHRVYQKAAQTDATAYYIFDRYDNNTTDMASISNMIELYMYGDAASHEHSVALYDGTFNETNFNDTYQRENHTSIAVKSSSTGKSYNYNLVGGGLYYSWESQQQLTTHKRYLSLQGAVPDVGDAIQLRIVYRNGTFWFDRTNASFYYGWVTVNMYTVDSTALRNAIALSNNVLDRSKYSESSYNAYRAALSAATSTLNSDSVPSQSNYDAKTAALVNAINNLERVQTVTLDSQSATTPGTTSVVATIGKAMPSITLPTREHYSFMGYFTQPDGKGIQYYNADGSSTRDFDLESDVTLYASWSIDKFNVKFVDYDGTVLRSGDIGYGTKPVYDGNDPTRAADDDYEYTFSGWSPEITEVTADATYTAQYSTKAHNYKCVSVDENSHQHVCADCEHKKAAEAHNFVYTKLSALGYGYKCTECGYSYSNQFKDYTVGFVCNDYSETINQQIIAGCTKTSEFNPEKSLNYEIVTIKAPLSITVGGKTLYFVYWKDAKTNEVVGTYTTYKYFQTEKESNFTPVYVTQQEYYSTRDKAVISSRIAGFRRNDNGSYSILAEHSVASSCKAINGHGVIYTTNPAYADSLTIDNDNVQKKMATTSANSLTGLFEVTVELDGADTVWARTYVIDADGNVHYGAKVIGGDGSVTDGIVKEFNTSEATTSGAEISTIGTASYDLTDLNSDAEAPIEDEKPTEKNPLEILKTIIEKLVEIINEIISYFTNPEARK